MFAPPEAGNEHARIILTRRTTRVGSHKGQIGFAGGRADPGDANPMQTALRETTEELGIAPLSLQVHGVLPAIKNIDGNIVVPVVASTHVCPEDFVISEDEVAYVIAAPWTAFTRFAGESFAFTLFGRRRPSHLFYVGEDRVWGLTARILYQADLRDS